MWRTNSVSRDRKAGRVDDASSSSRTRDDSGEPSTHEEVPEEPVVQPQPQVEEPKEESENEDEFEEENEDEFKEENEEEFEEENEEEFEEEFEVEEGPEMEVDSEGDEVIHWDLDNAIEDDDAIEDEELDGGDFILIRVGPGGVF